MSSDTTSAGTIMTGELVGPTFARALAARDFDTLQSMLDPEVE